MRGYRRTAMIIANEGLAGLSIRGFRKVRNIVSGGGDAMAIREARELYHRLVNDFQQRALATGDKDVSKYYWYHTVDLGDGLVTPGAYDYRSVVPRFRFPVDMKGMNVLDVGSATGFFAFEFARRGATVTSVDIPSIRHWDVPSEEDREELVREYLSGFGVNTVEQVQHLHVDGPFEFCRKRLNVTVKRCHSSVYELSAQKLGTDTFDVVFVGDVLVHLISPIEALAALAPLCQKTLILAQRLAEAEERPVMQYFGGEKRGGDTWWVANKACLEQMLKKLGFKTVVQVGHHSGVDRQNWEFYDRAIIHATK